MTQLRAVIIGAGVSGLTTAVELQKHDPGLEITVVAKHLPGDWDPQYTSPYAGANWHPFPDSSKEVQEFEKVTYHKMMELATNDPSAGIVASKCFDYSLSESQPVPWYSSFTNLQPLPSDQMIREASSGQVFDGLVISVPIYLNYLYIKAISLGATIRRVRELKTVQQALDMHASGEMPDVVINCSGLLGQKLGGFKDSSRQYGILGQVLHVRNNSPIQTVVEIDDGTDEHLYIFPRGEGGCIIGGCFREKYDNTDVDKQLTQRIIQRAIKAVPSLVDHHYKNNSLEMDIVSVNVGQRPYRDGGPRVEKDQEHEWLIHNYGAGGGGYQASYGIAAKVKELVQERLRMVIREHEV